MLLKQRDERELAEDIRLKLKELNHLISEAALNGCTVDIEELPLNYIAGKTVYHNYKALIRKVL